MKYKLKQRMKQDLKKKNPKGRYMRASLPASRSARTVLLQMARDEERGERVKALYVRAKQTRPNTTWREIADYVGVSERAAASWAAGGGMTYDNAKKYAEFFKKKLGFSDVDPDWLWRGPEPETPDLVRVLNGGNGSRAQLDRLEAKLDRLLAHFDISVDDTERQRAQTFLQVLRDARLQDAPTRTRPANS